MPIARVSHKLGGWGIFISPPAPKGGDVVRECWGGMALWKVWRRPLPPRRTGLRRDDIQEVFGGACTEGLRNFVLCCTILWNSFVELIVEILPPSG